MSLRHPQHDVSDRHSFPQCHTAFLRPKSLVPGSSPADEGERLAALRLCHSLDAPADPALDRLVRLAAAALHVPLAGISIVTKDHVWLKSAVGLPSEPPPALLTLCEEVIRRREGVTLEDNDPAAALRFLTGAPLLTPEGHALGALFVADRAPRTLTAEQCATLTDLAALTMREVAYRQSLLTVPSDHDPLTGLLNHRAFHQRLDDKLSEARRLGRPLTVLLLDLDDFRFVNDTHGHAAGDDVLRGVAHVLQDMAEELGAASPARYGGDTFALLLPVMRREETAGVTDALAARLERLDYRPPGHDCAIPLRLSSGAACFPDDGDSRRELLSTADLRLRRAQSGASDHDPAACLRALLARSVEGFSLLDALVTAVDNKDRYTRSHSEDVLFYCLKIAEAMQLERATQESLAVAALLHDVGKIGIPDAILRKPGRLSEEEFAAVKQHPQMGAIIVSAVPGFEGTLDAVRHHHERWDGGGYPFGLAADAIPLSARIMAVADAFSAMTTDRPYRKGMDSAAALAVLQDGAGTQWDAACVAAFLKARAEH